jgi:transposase
MTDQLKHKTYSSCVVIDIAKDFNVVVFELIDGKTHRFRMANSGKDHDRFIEVLREPPQPCHIVFEATGNYHRPLAFRLLTEGFDVSLILSPGSARYREAVINSWDKNDPKDAGILLELLKRYIAQIYVDPLKLGLQDI